MTFSRVERFLVTCVALFFNRLVHCVEPEIRIVSGIYASPLNKVIIYESTIPVSFEVLMPVLYDLDAQPQCLADGYICKLGNTTYTAYKLLKDEFLSDFPYLAKSLKNLTKVQKRGLFNFGGYVQKFLIGTATTDDIDELHGEISNVLKHHEFLEAQVLSDHRTAIQLTRNLTAYTQNLHTYLNGTVSAFTQELKRNYELQNRNEAALAYSINHLLHLNYMQHTITSLQVVAADCRAGRVPRNLIPEKTIIQRLTNLTHEVGSYGWEIATTYLKMLSIPVSTCTFSESSIFLTMEIPIKRVSENIQIYEFIPIPFMYGESQCVITGSTQYVAVDKERVIPITSHLLRTCRIEHSFCMIPRYTYDRSAFSECARAILQSSTPDQIAQVCSMECKKSEAKPITQISGSEVVVANAKVIRYDCPGHDKITYEIKSGVGAALLTLPCTCNITVDDKTLQPIFPCLSGINAAQSKVVQLVPAIWARTRSMVLDDEFVRFTNLSEAMNLNWNKEIPFLNISEPTTLDNTRTNRVSVQYWGSQYDFEDDFIIAWLIVLSSIFLLLGARHVYGNCVNGKGNGSLSPLAYVSLLPGGAKAAAEDQAAGLASKIWEMIKELEWIELCFGIILVFMLIAILALGLRILRYAKLTAGCVEEAMSFPDYDEPASRRRRN